MLRRLGRHGLLLSVPLFILLLITYRNHGQLAQHERPVEIQGSDASESEQLAQVHVKHKVSSQSSQWKVLTDGTVVHQGTERQHRNYSLTINNAHRCTSLRNNQSSFVVVVESDIVNFEARQLIRDTWGLSVMQTLSNYRVIFLVGQTHDEEVQGKLQFENHMYEDIVQITVFESFHHLTYKSINMLHWYMHFCGNANYLFKTDDDIYLHIPNIVHLFASTSFEGSILCHQNKSRKILRSLSDIHYFVYSAKKRYKKEIRAKFQKYLLSFDTLPGSLFPDYCSGFAYAMNRGVAEKLLSASEKIPYIGIEDVFVTGMCREKGNLSIVNNAHFRLKPFIQPIESKCAFENGRINSNEMTLSDIRKLWMHINTQGYYCKMTANSTQK